MSKSPVPNHHLYMSLHEPLETSTRQVKASVKKNSHYTKVVDLPNSPTTQDMYSITLSDSDSKKNNDDVLDATAFHTFARCGYTKDMEPLLVSAKDLKVGDCVKTRTGNVLVRHVEKIPEEVASAMRTYSILTAGGKSELIAVGSLAAYGSEHKYSDGAKDAVAAAAVKAAKTKATKAKVEPWAEQINKEAALDATKEKAAKAKATAAAGAKQKAAIKTIHKMTQMAHENDRKTHIRGGRKYLR